ncbi:MAG: hypothetical protein DHS20C04_28010 [Hyphococcus sp.]|nr:MAG: hypothetical protein DHS20C04_28010 [Marinicaulis sp.]
MFSELAKRTKYMDPALAERWSALAGDKIAALARPGRLTGQGRGRTLELYVQNGSAAAAVQMERDGLIARLNAYLGPGVVDRIAVIQTGRDPASPKAKAPNDEGPPESGELGAALASFRAAIRRRETDK